jgi:hypothetical protein
LTCINRPGAAVVYHRRHGASRQRQSACEAEPTTKAGDKMAGAPSLLLDDPWRIDAARFPAGGSARDKLAFLLNYAVLAPSSFNTQPWAFHLGGVSVDLRADRARGLPLVDPQGRELVIGCGAALLNLRVAMRGFGLLPSVALFPDPRDPDLLARVTLEEETLASDGDLRLRDAVPARRTNRQPFDALPVPGPVLDALALAARQEGATLSFLESMEDKRRVAELVGGAERLQLADPAFRDGLGRWVGQRVAEATERLAGDRGAMPDLFVPMAAQAARMFDTGDHLAAHDQARTERSPALALLATANDTPEDWLAAGQALQRALLAGTLAGVSASYLSQPIEVPAFRPRVAEAFGSKGQPQLLLRLGYGPATPPAARRPVREAVVEDARDE